MKRTAKPIGAVATVTLLGVFTRLIAFLFKIYLSRTLGAESLGLYQIALSVFLLFASITSSGVPLVISRKVAERDALSKSDDYSLFTSALIYSVSLSFFLVLVLMLLGTRLSFLFSDPLACPVFLIMVPALLSTAVYCVVRGWFWGKKMFAAFSLTETLEETLRILLSVFFLGGALAFADGTTAIAYAFTLSDIIVAVVLLSSFFLKGGTLKKPSAFKEIFIPSLPITAMRVSTGIFSTLLAILLPIGLVKSGLTAQEATATFGRITGMANPLLFVPCTVTGSIAVVLLPDVSALAVKREFRALNTRVDFGVNFSVLLCGLVMCLYLVLGEKITLLLYKDAESGRYLSVAALSMIPMCLSQMTQSVLNSIGKERQAFCSYLAGNLAMILLIVVLPRYCGAYSVAIATTVSFSIDAVLNTLLLHKATAWGRGIVKTLLSSFLFSFLCALFTASFMPLLSGVSDLLILSLALPIGACSYLLLCYASGVLDPKIVLSFVRKKNRPLPLKKSLSGQKKAA